MGFFKIFPAAAGIIALTASVSFARDLRDRDEGGGCRTTIVECSLTGNPVDDTDKNKPLPALASGEKQNVYRVAITHGAKSWLVNIDAYTGKVLDKRDL